MTSYYDVLGVARSASRDEIAAAAQALAEVPGADVACATLLDDARRAAHDRDLAAIASGYVDVAYALPLDPLGKLETLVGWLGAAASPADALDDWAAFHAALDGEVRR